jgi:hypothetical protein
VVERVHWLFFVEQFSYGPFLFSECFAELSVVNLFFTEGLQDWLVSEELDVFTVVPCFKGSRLCELGLVLWLDWIDSLEDA